MNNLPSKTGLSSPINNAHKSVFDPLDHVITPLDLNEIFRSTDFEKPPIQQVSRAQALFNRANIKLEWTHLDYNEIPDVKYLRLRREEIARIESARASGLLEDDMPGPKKTTYGIKPELLKVLPEVLLLGHTNSGKSSLINNLLVTKNEGATPGAHTQHAYVSRTAGFTKTVNCFNVSNKLRLVDSPGYGDKGEVKQGEIVLEYLERRHQLRRAFVLVDLEVGFQPHDRQILDVLIDFGVPFEVVFTKVDRVVAKKVGKARTKEEAKEANQRVIGHYERLIGLLSKRQVAYSPRFYFNNAYVNKFLKKRYGYKEIRAAIYDVVNS